MALPAWQLRDKVNTISSKSANGEPLSAFVLRESGANDAARLRQIFASSLDSRLLASLDDGSRELLIGQQVNARRVGYRHQFPKAKHFVVEVNGEVVGQLIMNHADDEIRIVDIALLPDFRDRGLGTAVLRQLLIEARQRRQPLVGSVASSNVDAIRLYRRLGFVISPDDGGMHRSLTSETSV